MWFLFWPLPKREKYPSRFCLAANGMISAPSAKKKCWRRWKILPKKEKADITEDALELLAQKAKGSMRDALSLMDQALGEDGVTMTAERLSQMLGSVTTNFLADFLGKMACGDVVSVFSAIDTVENDGIDVRQFFQDLRRLLGDLLAYGGSKEGSYGKTLEQCKGFFSTGEIFRPHRHIRRGGNRPFALTAMPEWFVSFYWPRPCGVCAATTLGKRSEKVVNPQRLQHSAPGVKI